MYESEVQTLVPFSSRCFKIVGFLLRRQLLPLPFFALVAPHVVLLHGNVQHNVEHRDGDQGAVPLLCGQFVSANNPVTPSLRIGRPTIIRNVILPINVTTDNTLHLNEHIVKSGRHGPGTSAVADATAPADLDWMGRWVR